MTKRTRSRIIKHSRVASKFRQRKTALFEKMTLAFYESEVDRKKQYFTSIVLAKDSEIKALKSELRRIQLLSLYYQNRSETEDNQQEDEGETTDIKEEFACQEQILVKEIEDEFQTSNSRVIELPECATKCSTLLTGAHYRSMKPTVALQGFMEYLGEKDIKHEIIHKIKEAITSFSSDKQTDSVLTKELSKLERKAVKLEQRCLYLSQTEQKQVEYILNLKKELENMTSVNQRKDFLAGFVQIPGHFIHKELASESKVRQLWSLLKEDEQLAIQLIKQFKKTRFSTIT